MSTLFLLLSLIGKIRKKGQEEANSFGAFRSGNEDSKTVTRKDVCSIASDMEALQLIC